MTTPRQVGAAIRREANKADADAKHPDSIRLGVASTFRADARQLRHIAMLVESKRFNSATTAIARLDTAVRDTLPTTTFNLPVIRDHWASLR